MEAAVEKQKIKVACSLTWTLHFQNLKIIEFEKF